MDCLELKKRYDEQVTNRAAIENVWNLIEKFIVPYRAKFYPVQTTSENELNWRRREIYDSTAIIANQNLAANIHANVTNPLIKWFSLRFRRSELNELHEAKVWLEEVGEQIYIALQESNFNLEANETYLDITSFGTSFLAEEVHETDTGNFRSLNFECLPVFSSYFEIDVDGSVINFYRSLSWTPLQIVDKFGAENVPENIRRKAEKPSSGTERVNVIFAIYKRREVKDAEVFQKLEAKARPYGFKYFLYDTSEQLGEEGGYYEMPVYAIRWRKTAGSEWGHSPAMVCLSDVLTLQQLVELIIKSAEKAVDPPIATTRRGVFGDVNLEAGGVSVVAGKDSIFPLESRARFDVSSLEKSQLQDSINRTFFMDQLQLKDSPAMTATEVNARFQLMQRLLGPTLGRLQSDFLDPLIERTFKILYRYQVLPPVPDILKQAGAEIEIEYLGTMARSQKYDELAAAERWLANVQAMAEIFPEVVDIPDADMAIRDMGLSSGVPAQYMNSRETVDEKRRAKQQQQETMETIALAQQGGEAMKSIGEGQKLLE
jgi:hypothetical protein